MIVACGGCKYQFEPEGYRDAQCPVCHEVTPIVRSCPACDHRLVTQKVSDITADECEHCRGIFLDVDAVRRMLEIGHQARAEALLAGFAAHPPHATPPQSSESQSPGPCPTCRTPMTRRLSPEGAGIILDVCATHGTFFDAGELHKIIEFAQRDLRERRIRDAQAGLRPDRSSDGSVDALETLRIAGIVILAALMALSGILG